MPRVKLVRLGRTPHAKCETLKGIEGSPPPSGGVWCLIRSDAKNFTRWLGHHCDPPVKRLGVCLRERSDRCAVRVVARVVQMLGYRPQSAAQPSHVQLRAALEWMALANGQDVRETRRLIKEDRCRMTSVIHPCGLRSWAQTRISDCYENNNRAANLGGELAKSPIELGRLSSRSRPATRLREGSIASNSRGRSILAW